eukprot:m.209974 g.209974  ORF g.209974 m.209974 type:complete len:315 (-) comp25479_c0_seq1:147-1091(-)
MVLVTRGRHPDRPSVVEVLLNQDGSPVWDASEHHDVQALFDDPAAVGTMVPIGDCTSTETQYWAVEVGRPHAGADVAPLVPGGTWTSARALAGVGFKDVGAIAKFDAAMGGKAVALLNWERDTKYCGRSGELMEGSGEGWRSSPEGVRQYPRIDPAVIMAVMSPDEQHCLLGQRRGTSYFTCLAGFVSSAESAEDACRRETREETGIDVGKVVLHSTQPWPVGRAGGCELMIGCMAKALSMEPSSEAIDDELAASKWYARDEVADALRKASDHSLARGSDHSTATHTNGELVVPGPTALAHHLLATFANGFSFQ